MSAPYRFDELGWLLFEWFCEELLSVDGGVARDRWNGGPPRGRSVYAAEGLPSHGLPGPTTAVALWVPPGRALPIDLLHERLVEDGAVGSLLFLTNAGTDAVATVTSSLAERHGVPAVVVYGPPELSARLDALPQLRRFAPFALGVRDLADLVDADLAARSTADLDAMHALAPIFVPTRAYEAALAVLERYGFAVLTGPPEVGKTAIARMIALAELTNGWEAHECTRPDELWAAYDRDRRQLFVADDAFGSTEYSPDAAERWALELDRVLRAMDSRHRLIWTSRPAPLTAGLRRIHREHGVERFPQPAHVLVQSSQLDVEEKALILFRHVQAARHSKEAISLVKLNGWEIVSNEHFTPERIRRFTGGRLRELAALDRIDVAAAIEVEIREPTTAMAASFQALPPEHRTLLTAMLDVAPGPVPERELAEAGRRHGDGLPRPVGELIDRLADHFLLVVPPASVTWVHPSWRDLVVEEVCADAEARRRFLERAAVPGLALALAAGGGATGDRALPFLVADGDWDAATTRVHELVHELTADEARRLLLAAAAAFDAVGDGWRARELDAFATASLELLRNRDPLPAVLLTSWFGLAERVLSPPPPPETAESWVDRLPALVDYRSLEQVNELAEWLDVAAVLAKNLDGARDQLTRERRVTALFDTLVRRLNEVWLSDLRPDVADRLAYVLSDAHELLRIPGAAHCAAWLSRSRPEPPPGIPTMRSERDAPESYGDRQFVARVLGDLRPG